MCDSRIFAKPMIYLDDPLKGVGSVNMKANELRTQEDQTGLEEFGMTESNTKHEKVTAVQEIAQIKTAKKYTCR